MKQMIFVTVFYFGEWVNLDLSELFVFFNTFKVGMT